MIDQRVSDAIVVWTGWRDTKWPSRDETRLVDAYGSEATAELLPAIRRLEDDFYASDARHTVQGLEEMADRAAEDFRRVHPEISDDAVEALAWCYAFDYK
jgi:hypothetical protein